MGWKKTASPGSKVGQTRNDSSKSGFVPVSPFCFCNAETDSTAPSYASRKDLGASPSRCVRPRTSKPPFWESLTSIATTTFTPPCASNSARASGFRKDASWCQAKPLPSENGAFVFTWSTAQRIVEFVSDKHTVSAMSLMRSERTSAANAPPRLEGEPILRSAPARMALSDFRPDALCVSKKTPLCLRERVNVFASSSSASVAACRASTSAASATPRTTTQPSRS
mmetsp:Transcript_491/g.1895  ORF Transcript_491/g.1895 Transcript_491/m.1895 type:complete len:225 (+) Transcript_491:563-1237(+)